MKNAIRKLPVIALIFSLYMPMLSHNAFAATAKLKYTRGAAYSPAFIPVLLIVLVPLAIAVFALIKKYQSDNKENSQKGGKYDFKSDPVRNYRDGFGNVSGNINDMFTPRNSEGLTENEQLMVDAFAAQAKAKKPDPVQIKCPNCGASVMLSDKVVCPYCRTEISNRSVAKYMKLGNVIQKERIVISPEDYNPRRYYDENLTGYSLHDINNDAGDGSANSASRPLGADEYPPYSTPVNNYYRPDVNANGSNYRKDSGGSEWGSGFLGGYFDVDQR